MQIGVRCPRGLIKHNECRRCSADPLRPCHLSPDMLEMLRQKKDYHADPDTFSPTGLLDCHRKSALLSRGDWYIDIEKSYPLLRGNLVHGLMEQDADRYPGSVGVIRETEMEALIETCYGPQRFIGKPDLVVIETLAEDLETKQTIATVKIVDYKSTSEIKHELTAALPDHVRQINMYAWLVRRWLASHYTTPLTVVVAEVEIQYLDFKKARRFTSAGPLKTKGKMTSRKPPTYATLDLEPVHLFDDETVGRGITRMIEEKLAARQKLPPAYQPDDEDYWRCQYCPVADVCRELEAKGV